MWSVFVTVAYSFDVLEYYRLLCVCFCADSSGPSSTVSSAGPSSPITADTSPRFSFSEKAALTPQSSEEIHSSSHVASQPALPSSYLPESLPSDPSFVNDPQPQSPDRPGDVTMDSTASTDSPLPDGPECVQAEEAQSTTEAEMDPSPPCSPQVELSMTMESFSNLPGSVPVSVPGSLPVLLELRESSSEAGSSTQTPLSPDEPQEFFNTQETVEVGLTSIFLVFICHSLHNMVQMAKIN